MYYEKGKGSVRSDETKVFYWFLLFIIRLLWFNGVTPCYAVFRGTYHTMVVADNYISCANSVTRRSHFQVEKCISMRKTPKIKIEQKRTIKKSKRKKKTRDNGRTLVFILYICLNVCIFFLVIFFFVFVNLECFNNSLFCLFPIGLSVLRIIIHRFKWSERIMVSCHCQTINFMAAAIRMAIARTTKCTATASVRWRST